MAHDCPECYALCHCGGDIDDINFGESSACTHYNNRECSGHREYCYDPSCECRTVDVYDVGDDAEWFHDADMEAR